MRKCRIGKRLGNHYRNYADMFETMSLLDIVSWTVGAAAVSVAVSVAVGWTLGKIVNCAIDKIGDDIVTDPDAEKPADNDE